MEISSQLNISLVREILYFLADTSALPGHLQPNEELFNQRYSFDLISNHLRHLHKAGFIRAVMTSFENTIDWNSMSLSDIGYRFLSQIQNETVWEKIKVTASRPGFRFEDLDLALESAINRAAHEISEDSQDKRPSDRSINFGHKVEQLRVKKGWGRETLAEKARFDIALIDRIENGAILNVDEISSISGALDVPFEELVSDTEYAFITPVSNGNSPPAEQTDTVIPAENGEPDPAADETAQTQSQPAETSQPAEELRTVQIGTVGDQPTTDDKLGFKPYVEAIAKFLMDKKTRGPLTLSIEGGWGSGKSSFMLQTEEELKKIDKNILTVHFNAWRYDKEDALWAAFATKVVKELSQKVSWEKRLKAKFELFRSRFDWRKGWLSFLTLGLVALSLFYLAVLLVNNYFQNPSSFAPLGDWLTQAFSKDGADFVIKFLTLTVAGYLILYVLVFRKINEFLINPLTTDFKKHLKAPDYKKRATFLEEFHEDFSKIIEAYAGVGENAQRVFVFIDDLDRCDVPKSAELMQALNLMLSENPQLYFIIGMDREKVAAGIAVKHEKLLEYLAPSSSSGKLEYGFEFIEKFIQVPFKVPQARPDDIENLIAELSGREKPVAPAAIQTLEESGQYKLGTDLSQPSRPDMESNLKEFGTGTEPKEPATTKTPKQEDVDSPEIDKVIKTVGPFFDYNPRRIKQFLNIYRLKIYIGNETGLFNHPPAESGFKRINLHKLGKFVAINLRYPMLIAELNDNPLLLEELQKLASGEVKLPSAASEYWRDKSRLKKLLKAKVEQDMELPDFYDKYGLTNINISVLLQISPSTKTTQSTVTESSQPAGKFVQ